MINVYEGKVTYRRGIWVSNEGVKRIEADEKYFSQAKEYAFEGVTAKSADQLVFLLGKRIQKENNLSYPVHIDLSEVEARRTNSIPTSSKRFDTLDIK